MKHPWKTFPGIRRRVVIIAVVVSIAAALIFAVGHTLLAVALVAGTLTTSLLVPVTSHFADRLGAVSEPGGRAVHDAPTPLFGGIALMLPVLGLLTWSALQGNHYLLGVTIGSAIIFALGVLDDVNGVRARTKLIVQLLAATVLVAFGASIPALGVHGLGTLSTGWAAIPLAVVFVIVMTNAMNIVDGLDGLASSMGLLAAGSLALLGIHPLITVTLAGCCLGFLIFNLPRARAFLGDTGSLTLGFLLSALALKLPVEQNVPLALALFAYPVGDVALAIARRVARGKPIMSPDSGHVHHKLREHLGGTAPALLFIVSMTAIVTLVGMLRPTILFLGLASAAWISLAAMLAVAGNYRMNTVLASRNPFRRLHVVHRYAADSIRLAPSLAHVNQALRHAFEALNVDVALLESVTGKTLNPKFDALRAVKAPAKASTMTPAVQRERINLVVDILARASNRIDALERSGNRQTVSTARRRRSAVS